jgi:hypothetical protein
VLCETSGGLLDVRVAEHVGVEANDCPAVGHGNVEHVRDRLAFGEPVPHAGYRHYQNLDAGGSCGAGYRVAFLDALDEHDRDGDIVYQVPERRMHVEDVAGPAVSLAGLLVLSARLHRVWCVRPERPGRLTVWAVDGEEHPPTPSLLSPGEALGQLTAAAEGPDASLRYHFRRVARLLEKHFLMPV